MDAFGQWTGSEDGSGSGSWWGGVADAAGSFLKNKSNNSANVSIAANQNQTIAGVVKVFGFIAAVIVVIKIFKSR